MRFKDRIDAGRALAARLGHYAGRPDVIVLALPRGGVPVATEVADALRVTFDVYLVRKLGVPGHEELAFGALAEDGTRLLHRSVIDSLRLPDDEIERVTARERAVIDGYNERYRQGRAAPEVRGRTVILVDDGLATGATMEAAVMAVERQAPKRIVVAVPVGPADACHRLARRVDEVVCVTTPEPFDAVGLWYADFSPLTDDQVRAALDREALRAPSRRPRAGEVGVG